MLIVALTGGIGSGKSTVSEIFKSKNVPIIDTDIIAREIVQPNKPAYLKIIETFGQEILSKDKQINRQVLRNLIFSSSDKRVELEKILHPIIWQEVKSRLNELSSPYCIVVVPLLIENLSQITEVAFNRILVIDVAEDEQIRRCLKRDHSDLNEIKSIIKTQVSRQERLDAADDVILNSNDLKSLTKNVEKLHQQYLKLSN